MSDRSTLERRFWKRVHKTCGCWLWTGSRLGSHSGGYGSINIGGTPRGAHRVSWELHYGPIPSGMLVMHKCDTPLCVRPTHLCVGSQSENMQDMLRKGRRGKTENYGERNGNSQLTVATVVELRRLHGLGWSAPELASLFSVSRSLAYQIVRRAVWRHVP